MSTCSRISPPEAVSLIEEAQCGEASAASSALQLLSLRLRSPHPTVTSALHDLLQIHPLPTIPHVPSLIPATPSVVSLFVESFSDLLSADRTLLVPIIGALADLPLSAAHATQARATLRYALSVVDAHDLPAVVRALARLCANAKAPASARWAATALRDALHSPPDSSVIPVLAHVLDEVCRPGNAVGAALRTQAGVGRVSWLDLVVWSHAVKASNGPYASGYKLAVTGVSAAVKGPLLAGDPDKVSLAVKVAAPALARELTGVRELVRVIADELLQLQVPRLEPILNFAGLVHSLVKEVPAAARGIVQELLAPSRAGSIAAEAAVLSVVDVLPRDARQIAAASRNVRVRVAVVGRDGEGTSAWSNMLVVIRKGLLFGVDEDRVGALALAREIVRAADADVVGELLAVMDNSISVGLVDALAVGFLEILAVATLRGLIVAADASRTLEKRIEQQCPSGMIKEVMEEGESGLTTTNQGALHIDIGLLWEQDPAAVSTVVSSIASLTLTRRNLVTREHVSVGMLNVLCLVPVVCIPLYNAVEDCTIEFDTAYGAKRSRGSKLGSKNIPSNVLDMDARGLVTAISSFAAGMAVIVGLLNTSSRSLSTCRRVLVSRQRPGSLRDGSDKETMWTLLERLTEFDRMLNALLLGYEVLQKQMMGDRKNINGGKIGPLKAGEGNKDSASSALIKAEGIRDSVLRSISVRETIFESKQEDVLDSNSEYPQFSLQAIVASLVAVPDEAGIEAICDTTHCQQTRDIELVRIDKLLLRQMLRLMTGRTTEKALRAGKREGKTSKEARDGFKSSDREEVERYEGLDCLRRIQEAIHNLPEPSLQFPYLDLELGNHEDVFTFDDDEFSDEEDVDNGRTGSAAVRWVAPKCELDARIAEYVRTTTRAVTRNELAMSQDTDSLVSDIIHSPCLASLLLDRAATYVAVARKGREVSLEDSFLSSVVTVTGFTLGCLLAIIRVSPNCGTFLTDIQPAGSNSGNARESKVREFLKNMDDHLIVGLPDDALEDFRAALEVSNVDGARSIATLHWISENSIDAAVSALALDALLVLSEFSCLHSGLARFAVLSSLTTIYEYDSRILWSPEDISLLFQDSFGEWSLRRREHGRASDAKNVCEKSHRIEQYPWVALLSKGSRRHRFIDRYRIHMFFEGMHVPHALLEACGWIRELALLMLEDPADGNGTEATTPSEKVAFRIQKGGAGNKSKVIKKHDTTKCEALIEMIGFRTIIATLMQLVHTSLQALVLSETFAVEDALDVATSPISHLRSALCVLCGILRLYRMNRDSLKTGLSPDTDGDAGAGPDHDFDHYIISSATSVLQVIRLRLDEVCSWYSNSATDLSRLTDEVIDGFEKVIGCAALAVNQCSEISNTIKKESASFAAEATSQAVGADAVGRRIPNSMPSKRKRAREDDVSRARRIIPRLSSTCDAVTKETLKLAKVMGFRAKKALHKFAPSPLEEDTGLYFGIGLETATDQEMQDEDHLQIDKADAEMTGADSTNANSTSAADQGFAQTTKVEGFQARSGIDTVEAELQPKTVTVQFKR